jgi:hypothetical protein
LPAKRLLKLQAGSKNWASVERFERPGTIEKSVNDREMTFDGNPKPADCHELPSRRRWLGRRRATRLRIPSCASVRQCAYYLISNPTY